MKPLLFIDFDGTICHDRFWKSLGADKQNLIQQLLFTKKRELVSQWMRGECTSEDINTLLAKELAISSDALWEIFKKDCETMTVPRGILGLIALLRGKFTVVLATDNMDCFSRFTVPALSLKDYFDDIVNSADVGVCKDDEDGTFFATIAKGYSLPITQSAIIDNSKKACQTIKTLGGKSYLVTTQFPARYWLETLMATS